MANVLVNCVSAGSGGALTYLINLVPELIIRSDDTNIKIFVLLKEEQYKMLNSNIGNNVIIAPDLGGYKRFMWEYFKLPGIIEKYSIDLVFTPYQIARIFKNIKNIVMFRNMEPFTFHKYKNTYKNWLRNYLLKVKTINTVKNSDKVIAVSDYVKKIILDNKITSNEKIVRIYHGRNERFTPSTKDDDIEALSDLNINKKYIFTCGSLFPYRKCEDIIEAYARLDLKNEYKLVIAGSSNDNNYQSMLVNLIKKYNLEDSVELLGHVALTEMLVLYRNCDIFVTSTETEACPNIAIEAMASGCSILSSDVMPLPEMFGEAATYYSHGDINELAIKMELLLKKNKSVNKLAVNLVEELTWGKCADATFGLIMSELNA